MRASVGRQRSLRRATRSSSATMDGSTTDVLSAEEYLDVVSPCVEFELQCLPHATVLQLQREIAERLNDLPIGCQIVVAPAAAATTTTLSSISRSNTATSMDRTEPADDDNDDGEVRTEVLPPVAEQQGEPRAATPASRRGAARGAVSPDGATEEQDDTASSATDNIAGQLPEAESSALPRHHRTNSGRVGQRGPAAVLMSHPFTSEYDDGILLAAPTPAPSNSARRADSREPIEDRNMANSPPPPPPATTVPVGAVSASPSRSSSPPRRARVLPDQVLVVVDGTPLMDPGMTVMDALVAYCSTTAGPFRKLVDAFLPRASSTLQQQQQHQQAMLLQATSRAHLQRAFSLWTATHSVTFAVRQQSPPASTTLATSRPVSLRVGIPRPLSREGACCPCHEYDRAAVEWERGRYYCHPAHFYPTPHDGERWVPTLPLAERQLQRGTNSDGEEGDDQSTEGAASRAADGDPDTNKVLKSILMLGDALSSLLALCSYLAGSSHGPRGPTSTANTPAATTSAAANRVGSPAPPFPQVPATTSATTTPSSPHRQRMTASSSSGGGWNISQAPDARCLHSALIHDIQVQLPSFAIPMVAALSHVAARTDAPYDDALACVAFWGYPHLFPFELRRKLFSVLVGAHRLLVPKQFVPTTVLANHQVGAEWLESVALQRIHYLGGEGQTSASVSTPMIKKAKLSLPRDTVGSRGMELLREYANCPLHLDVEFEGEAGTGLGPTLEFFSLLATALATRAHMWLGGAAAPDEGTPHKAPQGPSATKLFPLPLLSPLSAPMTNSPTSTEPTLFERAQFFEDVGIFLARILLDEHAVNFPLHPVFLRRLQCCPLSLEDLPTALHSVDPSLERTLSNLEAMTPESLEACDLTFVLPSDETVELQPNGRNTAVSSENVAEFCRAVRQHSLDAALRPAVECVHSAMRSTCVHPRLVQLFSSTEVGTLIGGSRGVLWDTEEALMASVSAAHGYSLKSRVVLDLVKTVVSWDAARQRSFLRFVSGSDCLPVGGLHPKLTVVRRDADPDITPSRASRIRNRSFNSTREGEDATPVSRDGVQVRTSIFGSPPPMAPRLDDTDTALTSVTPTNRRSRQLNEIGGGDTTDMEEEGIAFDRTAEAVVAEAIEASLQEPASLANASFTSSRTPVPGAAVAGFSFGAPPPVAAAPSPSTTPQHQVQSSSHLGAVIDARQELLDECLPTVNTCFHYLKLPDYSSRAVLEDRLFLAIEEGQDCFLLS